MVLSHNFDISPDLIPAMSREEFVSVFQKGFGQSESSQTLLCRWLNHPHWILDIRFSRDDFSPLQIGESCARILAEYRRSQIKATDSHTTALPEILILGGIKTTPATSTDPEALQPGDWGVDVVETHSSQLFLQNIGWEATIAHRWAKPDQRPLPESIFKVEWREKGRRDK